ncbi:lytic transglycosylase domain-containing protein [Halalkalibacter kiskunsagensis]|uniref:Lytic transglycosylase domain-containing protein n=1 Tax=Halalkalibacter kiskunsagensis TaxID=1548599 RepID=A0ABV6K8C2_9BACI
MKKWILLVMIVFTTIVLIIETKMNIDRQNEPNHLTFAANSIPNCYISLYKQAAEKYEISWKLLAAVHRVETIFSTMDPMISPVGAVGHFQFMPRTWVGWKYPGSDLGEIQDETDITDVDIIAEFGGYGIDASGTGKADPFNITDAVHAAAKYLADHGASNNNTNAALFAYNHSQIYVDEVLYFYNLYKENFEAKDMSINCFE